MRKTRPASCSAAALANFVKHLARGGAIAMGGQVEITCDAL
jgi:hypothetical protein